MKFVLVLLFLWSTISLSTGSDECTADYDLYATKTHYETVRWQGSINNECEPVHLWLLSRHGTRFTTVRNQEEILTKIKLDVLRNASEGSLCQSALEALRNWQMSFDPKDDMKLAERGWNELIGLGARHKALYSNLFPSYERDQYMFRHTNYSVTGNRTLDTARAYAQGLFGSYDGVEFKKSVYLDWLLQFSKFCDKYKKVDDQPLEEMDKFIEGPEMNDVLEVTATNLGLRLDYFDYELLDEVYIMCRAERGIFGESPWCPLLTSHTLRVFEFAEDIRYYWKDAYAHEISYQQACSLVVDVLQIFNDAINSNGRRGTASFGHSRMMNTFFARIGLFNDNENLQADGFVRQANRKWRTSLHTPMASNIALVLKSCPSGHKVEAFVNEEPIKIPGCDELVCDYGRIVRLWQPIVDDCDIAEICKIESDN